MVIDRKFIDPYTEQWNISIQKEKEMFIRTDKILAMYGIKRHSLTNDVPDTTRG